MSELTITAARTATRVVIDGAPVDVVRFGGTTSHVIAVRAWLAGNAYIDPTITTRDRADLHILQELGSILTAQPGDYVVRPLSGDAAVLPPLQYRRALGAEEAGLLERVRCAPDGSVHIVFSAGGQRLRLLLAHASLALQAELLVGQAVTVRTRPLPLPGRRSGDPFTDPVGQQVTAIAAA